MSVDVDVARSGANIDPGIPMWKKLIHLVVLGLGAYAWRHADLYSPSVLSAAVFPLIAALAAVYAFALFWMWIYRRCARSRGCDYFFGPDLCGRPPRRVQGATMGVTTGTEPMALRENQATATRKRRIIPCRRLAVSRRACAASAARATSAWFSSLI